MNQIQFLKVVIGVSLILLPVVVGAQQCTQATLNTEFTTDPTARGYNTCAPGGAITGPLNNDNCTLTKFNDPCTNNAACKVDNILSTVDIMQTLVDSTELETLANNTNPNVAGRKTQLNWLLELSPYNMAKASFQQKWKNVFKQSDAPLTNAAIDGAQQKDAPRSQTVCKRVGTINDVSCGLRGAGCQ